VAVTICIIYAVQSLSHSQLYVKQLNQAATEGANLTFSVLTIEYVFT